jgi:chemotaxis protein CheD
MEHFIQISEIRVARSPAVLRTVVGSCIALCLFDRNRGIGGMVHILLPARDGKEDGPPGRYADTAVPALFRKMQEEGSTAYSLDASLFGGAVMFAFSTNGTRAIGLRNADVVKGHLAALNIPVGREDIGGASGRRLIFDCATGRIDVSVLGMPDWESSARGKRKNLR